VTFRFLVHPLEAHGTTLVSGMSRQDVAPEAVVVAQPGTRALVAGPVGGACEIEAQIADRPHQRVELEQRPVLLQGLLEVVRLVRRAKTAPGDEVRAGRDGRGRVDLQEGQLLYDREQLGRPGRVEQLCAHGDAPGLRLGQPVHGTGGYVSAG
jgi:hypothetical protein